VSKTGVLLGRIVDIKAVPAVLLAGLEELLPSPASSAVAAPPSGCSSGAVHGPVTGSLTALLAAAQATAAAKASAQRKGSKTSMLLPQWKLISLLVSHKASKRGHFNFAVGGAGRGARAADADGDSDVDMAASAEPVPQVSASDFDETHTTLVTLPWLPAHSPLMSAPFLLRADKYADAVDRDLRPGAQVRVMFADVSTALHGLDAGCRRGLQVARPHMPLVSRYCWFTDLLACSAVCWSPVQEDDATRGEWFEGRVYYDSARDVDKTRGWTESRYQALRVVWVSEAARQLWRAGAAWRIREPPRVSPSPRSKPVPPGSSFILQYEQDVYTLNWYIETAQLGNEVSPWVSASVNTSTADSGSVSLRTGGTGAASGHSSCA
jgi:hypothetical protein